MCVTEVPLIVRVSITRHYWLKRIYSPVLGLTHVVQDTLFAISRRTICHGIINIWILVLDHQQYKDMILKHRKLRQAKPFDVFNIHRERMSQLSIEDIEEKSISNSECRLITNSECRRIAVRRVKVNVFRYPTWFP